MTPIHKCCRCGKTSNGETAPFKASRTGLIFCSVECYENLIRAWNETASKDEIEDVFSELMIVSEDRPATYR